MIAGLWTPVELFFFQILPMSHQGLVQVFKQKVVKLPRTLVVLSVTVALTVLCLRGPSCNLDNY